MRTHALLLAVAAAAVVVAAAGASGGQRYADPQDDAGTAPDITDVSVTSDDAGVVAIRVAFANRPALDSEDEVVVGLDTDRQGATGHNGLDTVVGVDSGSPFVETWSEAREDWQDVAAPSFRYTWDGGTALFQIDRRDLGWTSGFEFFVGAWDSRADEPSDYAPSDDDRWSYSLRLPFALRLASVPMFDLTGSPASGKTFTLGARVVREDTGAVLHAGTIACAARVGGKALARASKPVFFGVTVSDGSGDFTQALCDWKVPKTAKGKTLTATVSVSLRGKSATRTFTAKVR